MGRAYDLAYVLGIALTAVMTGYSIDRAKSGYKPAYHWTNSTETNYKTECQYTMEVYDPVTKSKKETTIYGVNHGDTALMMFGTTLVMFQTPVSASSTCHIQMPLLYMTVYVVYVCACENKQASKHY